MFLPPSDFAAHYLCLRDGGFAVTPFGDEPLAEVVLERPPLLRVFGQVRYATPTRFIASPDEVKSQLAALLERDFPRFEIGRETTIALTPEGVVPVDTGPELWRFASHDSTWNVTVGSGFLTLDTSSYSTRTEFVTMFTGVWGAFLQVAGSVAVTRVGVRYVNRVVSPEFFDLLPTLVAPEILGASRVGGPSVDVTQSMSEYLFQLDQKRVVLARWGQLPPGRVPDPALPAVDERSWVLDIDASISYESEPELASSLDIPGNVAVLGATVHRFFRWAVNDEFLRYFGGKPA